ncbi:MAG: mevalonate kinase [Polyangiales bacterium]
MKVFTAHGKVILLGEHAVVYGRPALAAAVSPGVELRVRDPLAALGLRVANWDASFAPGDGSPLGRAIEALAAHLGVTTGALEAEVHLPGGGGLGSSAAMGVASARALSSLAGAELEGDALLDAARVWEQVFHGNPSGVDHTLAALGGVGVFVRGEPLQRVTPRSPFRLCVADTGERGSTKEMVESVARMRARRTTVVDNALDGIQALVRNAALALSAGDLRGLGQLMDMNQLFLGSLMLSTERIETLCRAARDAGALGAKLTGAGGGGCVIALPGAQEAEVLAAFAREGAPAWTVEIR